jgi:hypothetical protein
MRRLLFVVYGGLILCASGYALGVTTTPHSAYLQSPQTAVRSLDVRIELRENKGFAGNVILRNISKKEIRVWRMGNSWGDPTLSFVLIAEGRAYHIKMTPQNYTVNFPDYQPLAPGQEYKIAFDLTNAEQWEQTWKPALPRAAGRVQLAAFHEAIRLPETDAYQVWTGSIGSRLVDVRYTTSGQ